MSSPNYQLSTDRLSSPTATMVAVDSSDPTAIHNSTPTKSYSPHVRQSPAATFPAGHPVLRKTTRPVVRHKVFKPTHASFDVEHPHGPVPNFGAEWNSRDARKGRYPVRPHRHSSIPSTHHAASPLPLRLKYTHDRLKPHLMLDISWWTAQAFWWGSAVWVCNGFCIFIPLLHPATTPESVTTAASALAFLGGTIFLIGAYLGLLEAGNRGKETAFGDSVENLIYGPLPSKSPGGEMPEMKADHHNHPHDQHGDVEKFASTPVHGNRTSPLHPELCVKGYEEGGEGWSWAPPMQLHDLGYLAAFIQMFAATVFWISTLTGLPGVISGFSSGTPYSVAVVDVFFWTPQVVGGIGFVLSSSLLILEVQPSWYHLKPFTSIGWQVGFWNLIGSIGFLVCGATGYSSNSKAIFQSDTWTFLGSWAFLIGSTFQVWEATFRLLPPSTDKLHDTA